MAGKAKAQVQEDISPNLIPMIDIMFLLLLFFMLGADMGQRELEDVVLPKAASVKDDDPKGEKNVKQKERLTINIYHKYGPKCAAYDGRQVCREEQHWRVGIHGMDYTDPESFSNKLKMEASCEMAKDPQSPQASERKVMIRADRQSPYGLTQKVMNVCANAGIYRIEVGAARPAEDKRKG